MEIIGNSIYFLVFNGNDRKFNIFLCFVMHKNKFDILIVYNKKAVIHKSYVVFLH